MYSASDTEISKDERIPLWARSAWYQLLSEHCFCDRDRIFVSVKGGTHSLSVGHSKLGKLMGAQAWRSQTNFYTLQYQLVRDTPTTAGISSALSLAEAASDQTIHEIFIDYLVEGSELINSLCDEFVSNNFSIHLTSRYENWRHEVVENSGDEYFSNRRSQLKNTLRRNGNKLDREHDAVIDVITKPGRDLDEGIKSYQLIYDMSWKSPEQYPNFIPAMIRMCAELDILRLGILKVDERPVAVQFWIVDIDTAFIFKLAYDPNFAPFSPGSLLTKYLVSWVVDRDEVDWIDYGVGSEDYKKDWMTSCRNLVELHAINMSTTRGKLLEYLLKTRNLLT